MKNFKFADMFAGIGGFHQVMTKLGGECAFACEVDKEAALVYEDNYGINPLCDICNVKGEDLKDIDVLCGGFPCQGFSIGGKRLGFEDTRGTLFFELARLLKECKELGHPIRYIVFENVKNLLGHDNGNTWKTIKITLEDLGYVLNEPIIVNPIQLGIPQNRERIIILGEYERKTPLNIVNILPKNICSNVFDTDFFEDNKDIEFEKYELSEYKSRVIKMWDEFKQHMGQIPVAINQKYFHWTMEEANKIENKDERKVAIKSIETYLRDSEWITKWERKYEYLEWVNPSHHRFEWQAGKNYSSCYEGFAQFRQSGLRIKKPDFFPCLVAIVQTSIVPKYNRVLTPRECARLQTFPDTFKLHPQDRLAYKQLGNSICIDAIGYFAEKLILFD